MVRAERESVLESERFARSEAERLSHLKDEFLATLSHELRSPLSAIIGWAEVARMQCRDMPEVLDALAVIVRNARFQARLVSDLLDVTRITSGKLRLEIESFDIVQVIKSALEATQSAAATKGITIESTLDGSVGTMRGDPNRMQQIVSNLLDNAVKFSSSGGRVDVRLTRAADVVEIVVADEGHGISPDRLPHVFDRFWQEDTSSRRSHTGLGLGLAIVKHLVDMHGGTVHAESAGEDRGAVFTVRLPCVPGREPPVATGQPHAARSAVTEVLRSTRILIVDDDADARRWMRQVLASANAEVMEAADAAQAMDAVEHFAPQVLVSDLAMPEQDGFDLLRFLRDSGRTQLPALALTAFASPEDKYRALSAGFQAFLAKPVDPAELLDVVARLVVRARSG
jgi:CheY-like chemotaxis protein